MLMLQRSEENDNVSSKCDDAAIKLACELDSDECPAACREDAKDEVTDPDEKAKSGDLEVSVDTNKGADAFLYG